MRILIIFLFFSKKEQVSHQKNINISPFQIKIKIDKNFSQRGSFKHLHILYTSNVCTFQVTNNGNAGVQLGSNLLLTFIYNNLIYFKFQLINDTLFESNILLFN